MTPFKSFHATKVYQADMSSFGTLNFIYTKTCGVKWRAGIWKATFHSKLQQQLASNGRTDPQKYAALYPNYGSSQEKDIGLDFLIKGIMILIQL